MCGSPADVRNQSIGVCTAFKIMTVTPDAGTSTAGTGPGGWV